jgi:uncharacterized protein
VSKAVNRDRKEFGAMIDNTIDRSVDTQELFRYVILRCVVGSRAYGLGEENSDSDQRGIYLPPTELLLSLRGVPEQIEEKASDECYWEMQKFLRLALKANPNILECLYTPLIVDATPLARELIEMRQIFLSRLIHRSYQGYAMSQFLKLEKDLRSAGAIRWKHAMHCIRLLISGIAAMREDRIPVDVGEYRDKLLAIKHGETPWEEIAAWRLQLNEEFDAAFEKTTLPDEPDYAAANAFLLKARRNAL